MKPYAIFDLDGTLIDSMEAWENIGREFLLAKGQVPPKDLQTRLKTMTMMESATYFRVELGIPMLEGHIIEEVNQMIAHKYAYEIPLKPYVGEYLRRLQQDGVKMCIVTACESKLVESVLRRCGIRGLFEFIITCTEVGMTKNTTDIFHLAANKLIDPIKEEKQKANLGQIDMGQFMIFEDALHAIEVAKKTGAYIVGVHDLASKKDEERIKSLCHQYIYSFKEL